MVSLSQERRSLSVWRQPQTGDFSSIVPAVEEQIAVTAGPDAKDLRSWDKDTIFVPATARSADRNASPRCVKSSTTSPAKPKNVQSRRSWCTKLSTATSYRQIQKLPHLRLGFTSAPPSRNSTPTGNPSNNKWGAALLRPLARFHEQKGANETKGARRSHALFILQLVWSDLTRIDSPIRFSIFFKSGANPERTPQANRKYSPLPARSGSWSASLLRPRKNNGTFAAR